MRTSTGPRSAAIFANAACERGDIGQIAADEDRSVRGCCAQPLHQLFTGVLLHIEKCDPRAVGREGFDDRRADSARAASDDDHAFAQAGIDGKGSRRCHGVSMIRLLFSRLGLRTRPGPAKGFIVAGAVDQPIIHEIRRA